MKKYIAMLLTASMITGLLGGCAGSQTLKTMSEPLQAASAQTERIDTEAADAETFRPAQWINSNILGNISEDMDVSPKDDLYLYVNKDWLVNTDLGSDSQVTSGSVVEHEVQNMLRELLNNQTQNSHEALQVYAIYNAFMDVDSRNAVGVEPLIRELRAIGAIESIEQLDSFITQDRYSVPFMRFSTSADLKNSRKLVLTIYPMPLTCGDAAEYGDMTDYGKTKLESKNAIVEEILSYCGFSTEEAAKLTELNFRFESMVAEKCLSRKETYASDSFEKTYYPVTDVQLADMAPNLPVAEILKDFSQEGIHDLILREPQWLEELNTLYSEENLECMKAWLSYYVVWNMMDYLDQKCFDLETDYQRALYGNPELVYSVEDQAMDGLKEFLPMAVSKMYVEAYVDPSTKTAVAEMIQEIVSVYRRRLMENQWLTEATREKAIEKLDHLTIRAAYPDDWSKYDCPDLNLPQGADLLTCLALLKDYQRNIMIEELKNPVDKDQWPMAPYEVNACYNSVDNSINIPAAILNPPFYDVNGSIENQLGGIGIIIGHEITHAFDSSGSQFDKDGNMVNWWTDEDRRQFERRTDKVEAYFSSIEIMPGLYVDGELTIGESVADLGGLSCMMEIADDMEGFDYRDFFITLGTVWRCLMPSQNAKGVYQYNPHPASYLRTNVNVQQFQQFYDAFGVAEGDGMYLAPEARLSVW